MTSTVDLIRFGEFLQYDGTNGHQMAAYAGFAYLSEAAGVLTMQNQIGDWLTMNTSDWWGKGLGAITDADLPSRWRPKSSVAATIPTPGDCVLDSATIAVPTLLLNASVDRTITWSPALPTDTYRLRYLPDANTLGKATFAVKTGTTPNKNTVTVTVTAGLAVAVSSVVQVQAIGKTF